MIIRTRTIRIVKRRSCVFTNKLSTRTIQRDEHYRLISFERKKKYKNKENL